MAKQPLPASVPFPPRGAKTVKPSSRTQKPYGTQQATPAKKRRGPSLSGGSGPFPS